MSITQHYLVAPPGDGCDHVATGGVPLHIRGHVVLSYVHHGAVRCVHEGKSSIHAGNAQKCIYICTQHSYGGVGLSSKSEPGTLSSTHTLLTSSVQPTPETVPGGSRICCWPAACQTSLYQQEKMPQSVGEQYDLQTTATVACYRPVRTRSGSPTTHSRCRSSHYF